jgi:hypothetical protein
LGCFLNETLTIALYGLARVSVLLCSTPEEGLAMAFEGMATPLGVRPGSRQQGVPLLWRRWLLAGFCLIVAVLVMVASSKWSAERAGLLR